METGGADGGAVMQDAAGDAEMAGDGMTGDGDGYGEDASGQQIEDAGDSEEW